jgi:glycosyltransferase involved in cell wall biosynthesis
MNNPLVSIITVTYNAQEHLEQTMQSVFMQISNISSLMAVLKT